MNTYILVVIIVRMDLTNLQTTVYFLVSNHTILVISTLICSPFV